MITGVVFSIGVVVSALVNPDNTNSFALYEAIIYLLINPFMMVLVGFFCMFIEAAFTKQFRFSEIEHPQWLWYVYPVGIIWLFGIALFIGMIMGKKKKDNG